MSYMKWASDMRAVVRAAHESGKLGMMAAVTQIPEYRLRDWVTASTIDMLSHTELRAVEDWSLDRARKTNETTAQESRAANVSSSKCVSSGGAGTFASHAVDEND